MQSKLKIRLRKGFSLGLMVLLPVLGNLVFLANTRANIINSNLTVEVDGLKNQTGQICFTIFSDSEGFPDNDKNALQAQCVKITETPQKLDFSDLKPGNYAIALIHDANEDGILNRNSFGIPTEGFGFSNNPTILTGPPKFNDSAVLVVGPNTNIQIKLQYFLSN
ncbi:DUF2141 domain-containing protein [Cronbergia sp. UHCC 0137]|uniref:DUF2141 domain-containing protein n=1 Tax=Cronbergia sp. UHCC 0137 TaxID=3110239 RepID=UPI002B1F6A9A|nr:DUF2141 domain-containing protein [Cronbergia sp. UHCC 0137]MEA5616515.1 DUF2141 domain-containing protein [Cronbergia sp. UHCC 0137]